MKEHLQLGMLLLDLGPKAAEYSAMRATHTGTAQLPVLQNDMSGVPVIRWIGGRPRVDAAFGTADANDQHPVNSLAQKPAVLKWPSE